MEQLIKDGWGQNWNDYCGMTATIQLGWEEKADYLFKAILLLYILTVICYN